jgi:putative two-component system response regulator
MDINYERETILVVDDVKENLDVLDGLLRGEYNVKYATNGQMAVNIAKRFLPDMVLLDIMMPGMDGFEVTEILKEDPLTKDIPIIFITVKDEDFDEARGFELGAADYITKPISPIVLKGRVRAHLALYNQQRQLAKSVNEKTKELLEARLEIIRKLGIAAEYKDNETGNHVVRMSKFCYNIAEAYGFDEQKRDLFLHTSPMHDIGKIGIPDRILQKPGRLNPEEWEIMKQHCEIGAKIIGTPESDLMLTSRIVALQHHEKWDGTGYPNGLRGEEIHIYARIVSIADVFDALVSERPYKQAWEVDEAVEYIRNEAGRQFDPEVVDAFIDAMPKIIEVKNNYS